MTLPTTIHFNLKNPRVLRDVQIVNRDTYNGTVTSMEAVITYTDGTKTEFKGGDFAKKQAIYTLTAETGKAVKSIDITPLTSEGEAKGYEGDAAKNRMLTLREINFHYMESDKPEVSEVDKSKLDAAVKEAGELKADDYKSAGWKTFARALEAAQAVLADDEATRRARLALCDASRIVLALTLSLLGVSAPEKM